MMGKQLPLLTPPLLIFDLHCPGSETACTYMYIRSSLVNVYNALAMQSLPSRILWNVANQITLFQRAVH